MRRGINQARKGFHHLTKKTTHTSSSFKSTESSSMIKCYDSRIFSEMISQFRTFSTSSIKLNLGKVTSTPYLPRVSVEEQFFNLYSNKKATPSETATEEKIKASEGKETGILILGPKGSGKSTFIRKMVQKVRENDNNVLENDSEHTLVIDMGSMKEWITTTYSNNNKFQKQSCLYFLNTILKQLKVEHERLVKKLDIVQKNESK